MRWPWERSPEEKAKDRNETAWALRELNRVKEEMRDVLDEADRRIDKELSNGR